ncbi:COX15/CtaA family protein [Effusibacillus lacus]|uniref:COX15/CtaA family protein n=1 Tax=Effusibacillus lacus TaxID=1348429 RepID=UPI0010DFB9E1|nr:COX15/CtaA family protein [Effusibacillus lacus]TCS74608.1 heme A synthase [Effusibacillus lacus]
MEFTHRTFSSLTGILILVNAVVLWKQNRTDRLVRILSVMSVVLLVLVGVMGGVNVLHKLPSGLTAIDMSFALLLLAVLVILTAKARSKDGSVRAGSMQRSKVQQPPVQAMYKPALFTSAAVYLESVIGGFFKHSSASHTYVHPETPLANELITTFKTAELVMYVHMFSAFLVVLSLFWLLVYARRCKVYCRQTLTLLILLGLQGFLGFFSLITKLELLTTTVHMAVAAMMLWISTEIACRIKFAKAPSAADLQDNGRIPLSRTVVTNG